MGLLDDAIREHLELKRRRGADPSEVAQQQREALAPVGGARDPSWEREDAPEAGLGEDEALADAPAAAVGDEHPTEAHEAVAPGVDDATYVVQETAEIDMQTVLDSDVAAQSPESDAPDVQDDDGLDWEMPSRDAGEGDVLAEDRGDVPPEIPGQERMPFE
jgi:hypothetical protein